MSKRILIVDDSSIMRKMITKTLNAGEHTIVGEAKNGDEAIRLYKELKPDLVTMDITMRGMDGFTAAKEIMDYDDHAQIIFVSNLDKEKYSEKSMRLGAMGYVSKHKSREILDIIEIPENPPATAMAENMELEYQCASAFQMGSTSFSTLCLSLSESWDMLALSQPTGEKYG